MHESQRPCPELKEKSDAEKPDILACSVRPNASLIGPQASE